MSLKSGVSTLLLALEEPFTAELLFDAMDDLVFFIKDRAGRYVCVNHTLVLRCGKKDKAELLGQTPSQVLGDTLGASYERQDAQVLSRACRIQDELELHTYSSGGVGWCLTSKYPLQDKAGEVIGLVGVSRDIKSRAGERADFEAVASAVSYAQAHLDLPPTLAQMAGAAGMSEYQLDRRMKRLYGLSTGQWLLKLRIDRAGEQLRQTQLPVAEVALNAGYADQSAFTRQFRKSAGMTPSQFRQLSHRC